MLILSTNVDQKSLETEFLIVICCPTGDKWQSKTLFLVNYDLLLSIVKSIFDCHLSGVHMEPSIQNGTIRLQHLFEVLNIFVTLGHCSTL